MEAHELGEVACPAACDDELGVMDDSHEWKQTRSGMFTRLHAKVVHEATYHEVIVTRIEDWTADGVMSLAPVEVHVRAKWPVQQERDRLEAQLRESGHSFDA